MDKRLGWRKDKYDSRDYLYVKLPPVKIPDAYSLIEYVPEVRDQGQVGSCVGFGIGGNLTGWANKLGVFTSWFSPTWIYNGARYIEGTLTEDAGAYPRDALEWLVDKGCLLEEFWPYDPYALDTTSPPSRLEPEAARHPLLAYYRVTGGTEGICSALASGHFVSIGVPWFWLWMDSTDGNLPEVDYDEDDIAGGHEVYLYGYDKAKAVFYGVNSWGTEWGDKGKFTMPFSAFDVFKQYGGYDAHYVTVDWEKEPDEPIDPVEPEKTFWQKFLEFIKKILEWLFSRNQAAFA